MRFGFSKTKVVRPIILEVLPMRRPGSRMGGPCADLSSGAVSHQPVPCPQPKRPLWSCAHHNDGWRFWNLVWVRRCAGRVLPTDQGETEQISWKLFHGSEPQEANNHCHTVFALLVRVLKWTPQQKDTNNTAFSRQDHFLRGTDNILCSYSLVSSRPSEQDVGHSVTYVILEFPKRSSSTDSLLFQTSQFPVHQKLRILRKEPRRREGGRGSVKSLLYLGRYIEPEVN